MTTILLVEDQPDVRTFTRRLLQRNGFEVIEADNAETAMRLWPDHGAQIDLVLTDLSMPGGASGDTLGRQLQDMKPGLPVVFTSGYGADYRTLAPLVEGENFIQKPSSGVVILETIRFALSAGESDANGKADLEPSLLLAEGRF
jgi:two-component system cell cycle sensor histidine kinase/response regulator CckA